MPRGVSWVRISQQDIVFAMCMCEYAWDMFSIIFLYLHIWCYKCKNFSFPWVQYAVEVER